MKGSDDTLISEIKQKKSRRKIFWIAVFAFVLQLALAAVTEKYPYDSGCFTAWALRMAEMGPGRFYAADYFCDYPPGYMLLLWLPGKLIGLPNCPEKVQHVLLAFWPALAGVGITMVSYHIGCRHHSPETAERIAAFAAFCPAILYDTGVWGQIDSVFSLAALCCFALLEEKKPISAALFYGLALAIKPQALLVGPALAICYLLPLLTGKSFSEMLTALKNIFLGAAAAVAPVLLLGVPFWGIGGLWNGLLEKYITTTSSYPYATINACNFFAFLGGEWVDQNQTVFAFSGLTWQMAGVLLIIAVTVFTAVWAWKSRKNGRFSPLLTAALYGIGIFTLAHRMHERYLIFAVVLLLGAAAVYGNKRLLSLAAGFSLTSLLNMALVFGVVGTDNEYLNDAVSEFMQRFTGLAETVLFVVLAVVAWQLTVQGKDAFIQDMPPLETLAEKMKKQHRGRTAKSAAAPLLPYQRAAAETPWPQPKWERKEKLLVLGLTFCTAVLSFLYLGDFTAPQTCLDTNGSSATFTVTPDSGAAKLQLYTGISSDNGGSLTITDPAGGEVGTMDLNWGTAFNWHTFALGGAGSYTITLADGQLFEIAFRDGAGALVPFTTDAENVADEQSKVPDSISQLNTFYFDEIYHARTGYEMLHGMTIYETTHPPLGKDFISLGIAIFGMTGFGWRFFGTLFGVLMVPLLYCFVRRMTRKPRLAAFAGILLALDFMRFSQSRIATIDTYAVFFILLAVDCMVWYCQSVLTDGVDKSILPMACGGVAFGLGCASKWTGIYAGAGLAILYFSVLFARRKQLCAEEIGKKGRDAFFGEAASAIAGGLAFFVVVPIGIYLLSYAPYWFRDHSFSLTDWWGCQTYMYWYHSTLEATHPFSSNWYSWLLDLRPVWYYMGSGLPKGMYASIAGFVSPVVAIVGLAAWLRTAQRQIIGEGSRAGGVLMVALLSSLLPWVMVTRCTFLYHYFPCVPFLIAAAALELGWIQQKNAVLAKRIGIGILAAAVVLFAWFYPVLSGLPVNGTWASGLQWLDSWGFYIVTE